MISETYFNPYTDKSFFGFLYELFFRLLNFITGNRSDLHLATDEIQILVLTGVALSASLVGTFLVLRKMTMLANSLSHTILVGIVIAFIWTYGISSKISPPAESINIYVLMVASLIMGLVTTFLTELLTKGAKLQEDASTGIVFTSLFALGVILVTLLTRNAHVGTDAVMGNVDALQAEDCVMVYIILIINTLLFFAFFKEYKITTFDVGLSKSFNISPALLGYLLMTQVSLTAIGAYRAVGVLMLLAFITGPALTARMMTHSLKKLLFLGSILGASASIIGVALSRHIFTTYEMPLSTSGVVVCVIVIFYIITACFKYVIFNKLIKTQGISWKFG